MSETEACQAYIRGRYCSALYHCWKCYRHLDNPWDCPRCDKKVVVIPKPPPLEEACAICAANGFEETYAFCGWKSVVLAPQQCPSSERGAFSHWGRSYVMIPICEGHQDGWWDASDVPRAERPPFRPH